MRPAGAEPTVLSLADMLAGPMLSMADDERPSAPDAPEGSLTIIGDIETLGLVAFDK